MQEFLFNDSDGPASAELDVEDVGIMAALSEFVVHIFAGTIVVLVVASVAAGLNIWVQVLERAGVEYGVCLLLRVLEFLILVGDFVLAVIFYCKEASRLIRKILRR